MSRPPHSEVPRTWLPSRRASYAPPQPPTECHTREDGQGAALKCSQNRLAERASSSGWRAAESLASSARALDRTRRKLSPLIVHRLDTQLDVRDLQRHCTHVTALHQRLLPTAGAQEGRATSSSGPRAADGGRGETAVAGAPPVPESRFSDFHSVIFQSVRLRCCVRRGNAWPAGGFRDGRQDEGAGEKARELPPE